MPAPNFIKDNRKIVGMDLDDVLANFMKTFMDIARRLFQVDPNVLQSNWDWDGCKFLDGTPLTPEQKDKIVVAVWDVIIATPDFWQTLEVMPGVDAQLINKLDYRTKLYFPTARAVTKGGIDVGRQSATWLRKNFLIAFPTVFVSNEKGPLAAALKYDYFIDDRPTNCEAIKKANPTCQVFLMNASHNQDYVNPEFQRVYSVNEFAEIVLKGE
jgi:5'(3')-deoxyribonucleotidase